MKKEKIFLIVAIVAIIICGILIGVNISKNKTSNNHMSVIVKDVNDGNNLTKIEKEI